MIKYVITFCVGVTLGIIGVFWINAMKKQATKAISIEWKENHLTLDNNYTILECVKDTDYITIKEIMK